MNTASCKSRITFIDGDKGIPNIAVIRSINSRRRARISKSLTLLLNGELPNASQLEMDQKHHLHVHQREHQESHRRFHYNAHPMGMFEATLGALSTFIPTQRHLQRRASL